MTISAIYFSNVGDQIKETFNDSIIQLDHKYWSYGTGNTDNFNYMVNEITIKNIDPNNGYLENVSVLLDADDNSVNWDVDLINSEYSIVENLTLNFGSIKSGQSVTNSYRWIGKCLNGVPGKKEFKYNFNIMPSFTIIYNKAEAWVSSGTGNPVPYKPES